MPTIHLSDEEYETLLGTLNESLRDPMQGEDAKAKINSLISAIEIDENQSVPISPRKIQMAHDILQQLVAGDIPSPFPRDSESFKMVHANLTVLCWVLGHTHIEDFGRNIKVIMDFLEEEGYELRDTDELKSDLERFADDYEN